MTPPLIFICLFTRSCQQVAYRLYDSLSQRFIALSILSERTKLAGLGASESSRVRQYEERMLACIERLRMIKFYRTSQTLNAFFNIFTLILPPLFASTFAGMTLGSNLEKGREYGKEYVFAILISLVLHALFEGVKALEDVSCPVRTYSCHRSTSYFMFLFKSRVNKSHSVSHLCDCHSLPATILSESLALLFGNASWLCVSGRYRCP
jgi:hypothetical protein